MAEPKFYMKDVESKSLQGEVFLKKNVLHFACSLPSLADPIHGVTDEIDVPAEASHLRGYPAQLNAFLGSGEKRKILFQGISVIEAEYSKPMEVKALISVEE